MNSTVYAVDEYGNEAEDIRSGYVGEFKKFGFSGVPKHCLACDGSEISRATYSELFEVFGETYGAGDGETTFNLPDFRGAFLRCMGGNAAVLGVEQGDTIRNINGKFDLRPWYSGSGWGAIADSATAPFMTDASQGTLFNAGVPNANNLQGYKPDPPTHQSQAIIFNAASAVPTANEVRPINFAVNICVVYE